MGERTYQDMVHSLQPCSGLPDSCMPRLELIALGDTHPEPPAVHILKRLMAGRPELKICTSCRLTYMQGIEVNVQPPLSPDL